MLEGCSDACPAHVALRAADIRQNKVAQQNHWDYLILLCCTTFLSHQKQASFFPNIAVRTELKIAI